MTSVFKVSLPALKSRFILYLSHFSTGIAPVANASL